PALAGELGDLLLQVILHAQLAAEAGVFDLADVHEAIGSKIVRRHPHVFGDAEARTAADVSRQWERIKAAERAEAAGVGDSEDGAPAEEAREPGSALDGISSSLPALDALWDAAKASERDARAIAAAGSRAGRGSEETQ